MHHPPSGAIFPPSCVTGIQELLGFLLGVIRRRSLLHDPPHLVSRKSRAAAAAARQGLARSQHVGSCQAKPSL